MKYYIYEYEKKYVDSWDLLAVLDDFDDLIRYLYRCQEKTREYVDPKHSTYQGRYHMWNDVPKKGHWADKDSFIYYNTILDKLNMTGNDMMFLEERWYTNANDFRQYQHIYVTRPYMVKDEDGRTIDVRRFYDDILNHREYPWNRPRWKPNGAKRKWRSKGYRERSIQMGQLVRMYHHPDFQKYNRKRPFKSVISANTWYDYPARHNEFNWKRHTKKPKQYMKHMK